MNPSLNKKPALRLDPAKIKAMLQENNQFREFFAVLKLGSGKTLVNTGFIILPAENVPAQIVLNLIPFDERFSLDQMKLIRHWIMKKEGTPPPTNVYFAQVESVIPVDEMIVGEDRDYLFGLQLFGFYTQTSLNRSHEALQKELDPCIFASSMRIYFNNIQPGKLKTDVEVFELGNKVERPILTNLSVRNGGMLKVVTKDDQVTEIAPERAVFCDTEMVHRIQTARSYLKILNNHRTLFGAVTNALIRRLEPQKTQTIQKKGKKKNEVHPKGGQKDLRPRGGHRTRH